MSFAHKYLNRYSDYLPKIEEKPASNLGLIMVIPAFNEFEIIDVLEHLKGLEKPQQAVEILIVVNFPERAIPEVKQQNIEIYNTVKSWAGDNSTRDCSFYALLLPDLPKKKAGVGFARKTGMDEASYRFSLLNKPKGILISYDADTLCDSNYFIEIEKYFQENEKSQAACVYFEHPLEGNKFEAPIYDAISKYELHLRYYNQVLRYTGYPYAYHTVGSAFCVRSETYVAEGGMSARQAGEDFYFLQKIIPNGSFGEINNTRVIPSPRMSDRVPFGTGPMVAQIQSKEGELLTYHFGAFQELKALLDELNANYEDQNHLDSLSFTPDMNTFLDEINFESIVNDARTNSSNLEMFRKRFYKNFNAFQILKFLNFMHERSYGKQPVLQQAKLLWKEISGKEVSVNTEKELLEVYRKHERLGTY